MCRLKFERPHLSPTLQHSIHSNISIFCKFGQVHYVSPVAHGWYRVRTTVRGIAALF